MELFLTIKVLHCCPMYANDIAHRSNHGQILLSLSIDDHRSVHGCVSLVMERVVNHFQSADESALLGLVGVACVEDGGEEVELV